MIDYMNYQIKSFKRYPAIYIFLVSLVIAQNNNQPAFINYINKEDVSFIIDHAPSPSAFKRTKKLLSPYLLKKNWRSSIEILNWSKSIFLDKDENFDTSYFDELIDIISRKDKYFQRKAIPGQVNTQSDEYWPSIHYDFINDKQFLYFTRIDGIFKKHEEIYVS